MQKHTVQRSGFVGGWQLVIDALQAMSSPTNDKLLTWIRRAAAACFSRSTCMTVITTHESLLHHMTFRVQHLS